MLTISTEINKIEFIKELTDNLPKPLDIFLLMKMNGWEEDLEVVTKINEKYHQLFKDLIKQLNIVL